MKADESEMMCVFVFVTLEVKAEKQLRLAFITNTRLNNNIKYITGIK